MLRRKPTVITLTSEDVAAYEDSRRAASVLAENKNLNTGKAAAGGVVDPNDELKPLPGDKARVVRLGGGGASREERIVGR